MASGGPRITLHETGASRIAADYREIGNRLRNFEMLGHTVLRMLEEYEKRTWGTGATYVGSTRERWPGTSPLHNTGRLKASLTEGSDDGSGDGGDAIRKVTPYGIEFGSRVEYLPWLQYGTSKMSPKRPLKTDRAMRGILGHIMRQYIVHGKRIRP